MLSGIELREGLTKWFVTFWTIDHEELSSTAAVFLDWLEENVPRYPTYHFVREIDSRLRLLRTNYSRQVDAYLRELISHRITRILTSVWIDDGQVKQLHSSDHSINPQIQIITDDEARLRGIHDARRNAIEEAYLSGINDALRNAIEETHS